MVIYLKLPVVSGEDTIKALCKAGFRVVRQKGSHVRLEKKKGNDQGYRPVASNSKKGNSENYTEVGRIKR